jgi:hypothetical protein
MNLELLSSLHRYQLHICALNDPHMCDDAAHPNSVRLAEKSDKIDVCALPKLAILQLQGCRPPTLTHHVHPLRSGLQFAGIHYVDLGHGGLDWSLLPASSRAGHFRTVIPAEPQRTRSTLDFVLHGVALIT